MARTEKGEPLEPFLCSVLSESMGLMAQSAMTDGGEDALGNSELMNEVQLQQVDNFAETAAGQDGKLPLRSLNTQHSFLSYIQKSPLLTKARIFQDKGSEPDYRSTHEPRHHVLLLREQQVSLELLKPDHSSQARKSSPMVAMINMVATVCGGGVLSLPLAFSKAGILPTTLLMIYGALTTDLSLYLLVACARRTGGRSYGDVAMAAFGSAAQVVTTVTLTTMLCGALIAYQVLVKDVWTPVLLTTVPGLSVSLGKLSDREASNLLLAGILLLAMPLLLKRDLHALRHTCYIGFGSCILLLVAVFFRAAQKIRHQSVHAAINWYSTDPADWLFCFPIVVLCFFCSYNILEVHAQLMHPTRLQIKRVIDHSMMICLVLFYTVGLCGYLYAGTATADNILLNFPFQDSAVLAGRIGFCFTLLFGLPLVLLPCREAALSIPAHWRAWRQDVAETRKFRLLARERNNYGAHLIVNGVDFDATEPHLVSKTRHGASLRYGTACIEQTLSADETDGTATNSANSSWTQLVNSDEQGIRTVDSCPNDCFLQSWKEQFSNVVPTVVILLVTYFVAISVPGVAAVWSICGSSMAIWIAFIVPTACYLKIREHKGLTLLASAAWLLLITSGIAMVLCTRQAVQNATSGSF